MSVTKIVLVLKLSLAGETPAKATSHSRPNSHRRRYHQPQ